MWEIAFTVMYTNVELYCLKKKKRGGKFYFLEVFFFCLLKKCSKKVFTSKDSYKLA